MSQTIISLIHCLQGKIDVTNVTHTWYLCFLCTTRGPNIQFLMAFSNYILHFYIWYELVHSFTSSQAKDKSCYREAKNTFLPKWNIVWILCKGSPPQTPGGYLWIQNLSHYSHSHSHTLSPLHTLSFSLMHTPHSLTHPHSLYPTNYTSLTFIQTHSQSSFKAHSSHIHTLTLISSLCTLLSHSHSNTFVL